jgi:hemerythrin-like domain-containing protein
MPAQASPHSAALDVLDTLIEDHHKILRLFDEFRNIKDRTDDETKRTLAEIVCTELVIHAQIEEEFLYPALREAFDDPSVVEEAIVEHGVAMQLISALESMHPGDDLYDAKFTVLGEYVKHHIEEEQNKIFPELRKTRVDLFELGSDLLQRRMDLRSEFGIPDEGYEEDVEDGFHQPKWRHPHHH